MNDVTHVQSINLKKDIQERDILQFVIKDFFFVLLDVIIL